MIEAPKSYPLNYPREINRSCRYNQFGDQVLDLRQVTKESETGCFYRVTWWRNWEARFNGGHGTPPKGAVAKVIFEGGWCPAQRTMEHAYRRVMRGEEPQVSGWIMRKPHSKRSLGVREYGRLKAQGGIEMRAELRRQEIEALKDLPHFGMF